MQNFNYSFPTKVYFGEDVLEKSLKEQLPLYGKNVLLTYGQNSIKKNGIYERVIKLLNDNNKNVIEFSGIMPNPTYDKVQQGAKVAKENNIDVILAVGGGSVIDASKVISGQALLDEDIFDYEYVQHKQPQKGIPIIAVVTVSGTGSECNGGAVITYNQKNWKGGIFATIPSVAVLDVNLTKTVSKTQLLSGAFDTLSHAMETYFGNSDTDNVSDDVSLAIMKNTVVNIRRVIKDENDMQARGNLMWDSAMAENGILKVGRKTDFQVHQIEHQLGAYTDCNHGQGLAVIHPVYYSYIKDQIHDKLLRLSKQVFAKDSVEDGINALKDLIKDCGLATNLKELKSSCDITKELLHDVAYSTNVIKTNGVNLTQEDIYNILIKCM